MTEEKPDLVAVLEHYGAEFIPEADTWRRMKCPFHDDKSASASVWTEEGIFKCHACDISGDVYSVVMAVERVEDFGEAKRIAEEAAGGRHREVRSTQKSGGFVPKRTRNQRRLSKALAPGRGRGSRTWT